VTDDWTDRVAAVWAAADDMTDEELRNRIDALAAERPDDPRAIAERGGARDSTGLEAEAEQFYLEAITAGLADPELSQVTIQLASTLRNLDRPDESIALLRNHFGDRPDHPLAGAARVFIALALVSAHREREAVVELLRAVVPTLPRYQRSVGAYADEIEQGER
jgi:predicted transcriptional regulator